MKAASDTGYACALAPTTYEQSRASNSLHWPGPWAWPRSWPWPWPVGPWAHRTMGPQALGPLGPYANNTESD